MALSKHRHKWKNIITALGRARGEAGHDHFVQGKGATSSVPDTDTHTHNLKGVKTTGPTNARIT